MSSNVGGNSSNAGQESIWSRLRKEAGARLREERSRLNLSQSAFAEKVGVHRRTQVNYEAGEREPDAAYYEAAAALGVDTLYVVEGERLSGLPGFAARIARRFGGSTVPTGASANLRSLSSNRFGATKADASHQTRVTRSVSLPMTL